MTYSTGGGTGRVSEFGSECDVVMYRTVKTRMRQEPKGSPRTFKFEFRSHGAAAETVRRRFKVTSTLPSPSQVRVKICGSSQAQARARRVPVRCTRALFGYNYRSTCTAGTCTYDTYQLEYVPSALVALNVLSEDTLEQASLSPSDSETKNVPCARSGHTLSVIGNTGFLFGGLSAGLHDKIARPLNELHILKMGSSEFEWCLLELADGQKPLAKVASFCQHL